MTLLLAMRGTRLHPSKFNPSMHFDETIFEPKISIGATHMNSPIYSGSDVSLERSSKAMNDELLVLAAKSGDTAAFVELDRDPGEPRCEAGSALEFIQMKISFQKGALQCIFRVFPVPGDPVYRPREFSGVTSSEFRLL